MCPISIFLFLLTIFLTVVYVFLTWNFSYWKKRGIQTASTWPFVGSFPSIFTRKRNIAYDIDDIYQKYKDTENVVGVFTTRVPQLLIMCPEYIHKIYATDFRSFHNNEWRNFVNKKTDMILGNNPFVLTGDEWKERRGEIMPALSPNRVKAVYPVSQSVCKKFADYIRRQQGMATSQGLDAMDLSLCFTTEVVSDCGLGVSAQSFTDTPTPLLKMIKRVFNTSFEFIFYSVVTNVWQTVRKFYSVPFFNKETEEFFLDIIRRCITLRQEKPTQQRDDFLNYMLQLQEKKGLDTSDILINTMTFILDGFETTALVLAHIMLMLGRNPEDQQKLREEVGKEELTFDQMSELPYLDACIYETLRLFSPQVAARKLVTEPYDFVNKNGVTVRVNPGDVVTIPVKALHHDPQYYENPMAFKPERFLEINGGMKKYRDRGVYLAFGDGPRHCPGMRFALTQLKAALVEIVRNFEIKVNPKTRSDNQLDDTFFMATLKGGIWLDFKDLKFPSAFAIGCAMCPICCALLLIVGFLALVYVFLTWNFDYWRKRGIQTATSWPFVGSFPSIFTRKRNMAYDIDDIYQQYKGSEKIVGVFATRLPQLLVLCPEYIHKIYATDFRSFHDNERGNFVDKKVDKILGNNPFVLKGDEWKERRAEITPGLAPNRVKAVYPVSQSVCKKFVDYIRRQQRMATSQGLDAMEMSLCFTTEVVSDSVLGISAQSFTDTPTPLVGMIQRVFNSSFGFIFYSMVANIWPPIRRFYSVALFTKEAEDFFFDIMRRCINLRREKPGQQRDDFLNYMLQLQEKKGLDTVELTSHTMTFLTDGFETTALVLSHTLLMLGRHPEEQQKVREEIGNEALSFEQLTELPYLEACIHETLRLFSPQVASRKLVTEPYDFVNNDGVTLRVNPGDVVTIPVKALHHDPQYYESPESFKPERFLEANGGVKKYRDRGVYLPFGDGPRICPGVRFALTQLKAALVEIVRNFDIKVNPKTRSDDRLDDTFFMATLKGGIFLDFKERS
ncbi:uncharacterized protein LOC108047584 [Drosophila rhopaloa]|uniref:Cytochrome P450 28d2 n=3 Tax=Drosophila rhopaloa TaxID=1041015 RepID=A0ABM5HPC2_DRORH|nr:uncharacterized protein LOC108047584 [Drosophila rhopaloa]